MSDFPLSTFSKVFPPFPSLPKNILSFSKHLPHFLFPHSKYQNINKSLWCLRCQVFVIIQVDNIHNLFLLVQYTVQSALQKKRSIKKKRLTK